MPCNLTFQLLCESTGKLVVELSKLLYIFTEKEQRLRRSIVHSQTVNFFQISRLCVSDLSNKRQTFIFEESTHRLTSACAIDEWERSILERRVGALAATWMY